jgi:hypothetical protein
MAETPTSHAQNADPQWTGWHTVSLVTILAIMVLAGLLFPARHRLGTWVLILLLLAAFAAIAGQGITGLWSGLLIDERNKISLSRLQMTLWSIVVLSGLLTAALSNVASGQPNPLGIAVPSELWLLMGISTTSLVASPLIESTKKGVEPSGEEKNHTFALLAKQMRAENIQDTVTNRGQLVINVQPESAQWSDMFRGEEIGNAAHLDLGKIQLFYFTVVLVLAYAVALGTAFAGSAARIGEFPALDSGIVALLGISHAGYLTHKAIPHSESA